ncbi:MAG: hypothetical protein HLUCCA12_01875 [Rhodobacteraceae bacterium HLUCCA12]|nr:MAG: hypothetical protein HLUCCA12_01875 [Rhodobacteraceae bacterium HLUCCA12]
MNITLSQADRPHSAPPLPDALRGARSLMIVEAPGALALVDQDARRRGVVLTRLSSLNPAMLAQVAPDAVIGPLIGPGWDSLDLAIALEEMGYRRNLFILSRPLPHRDLVLRELRACCPKLGITLIETQ